MATTIHVPDELLSRVDERAKKLKITRNRYIVEALRKALAEQTAWSPDFLEQLDRLEPVAGVDELMRAVKQRRTRKAPPRL